MEMWTKYENFALLFYNASVLELFSLLPLIHLVIYYSSRDGDRNTTKILVALRKALWGVWVIHSYRLEGKSIIFWDLLHVHHELYDESLEAYNF